jgi:transposase
MIFAVACLGIDVSKAKLDGAVELAGASAPGKGPHKIVPNTPGGAIELCAWAKELSNCEPSSLLVVMEVTAGYHVLAATTAHELGHQVAMASPGRARPFARALGRLTKSDKVDAQMLARLGLQVPLHPWHPPPPAVNELYALLSRRGKLDEQVRRDEASLEPLERKGCPAAVRASIDESIRFNLEASHRLAQAIEALFERELALKRDRDLLMSIPSIGVESASYLIWLLRSRTFSSAREVAALCGVVPIHRRSGTDASSGGRISKASQRLIRVLLHMPALNASTNNPQMKALYERMIANGKHHNQAIIAVIRRLVHIAFGVLKHQKPYHSSWTTLTLEQRAELPDTVKIKRARSKIDRRRTKLHRALGLPVHGRPWTESEFSTLREQLGQSSLTQISQLLGRTPASIRMKLRTERLPPPGKWAKNTSIQGEAGT